ncbi:MAG: DUF5063 domain-containing protein [Pyrinomonadaceae bacterium]
MAGVSKVELRSAADRFAAVARRYCEWAEAFPTDADQDLVVARELLAELHLAVLRLPDDCLSSESPDGLVNAEEWKQRYARFEALPVKSYWKVFDALVLEEPVFNTLADDLSDIWRDVKEGLLLYESGEFEEAVWEWRFNYEIHWGRHLLGAQYAIYSYLS